MFYQFSEEDNDDIIPILERESSRFKELYGEFYISEMMRYPDGLRQLIVAEADGVVTGVLCLNETVDIQTLNRHFELGPYHGLRKPHMSDKILRENDQRTIASEILFPVSQLEKKDRLLVKTNFILTSGPLIPIVRPRVSSPRLCAALFKNSQNQNVKKKRIEIWTSLPCQITIFLLKKARLTPIIFLGVKRHW